MSLVQERVCSLTGGAALREFTKSLARTPPCRRRFDAPKARDAVALANAYLCGIDECVFAFVACARCCCVSVGVHAGGLCVSSCLRTSARVHMCVCVRVFVCPCARQGVRVCVCALTHAPV